MQTKLNFNEVKLAVIGLGYVGLPLAVEFGQILDVKGFDVNPERISQLNSGQDVTGEVEGTKLEQAQNLSFTNHSNELEDCNFFIITVPTPIDGSNKPDLSALKNASKLVARLLKIGDIVVYESTVFPGCTEDVCVPILEEHSQLMYNRDFFCGYSPERINPGDKLHRLPDIVKVTSGSTEEIAEFIDGVYKKIVKAGTHMAPSIKVAEAAKVIENTQRDLNIALINELSIIFNKLEINTEEVLKAAESKWNFLRFRPGLVGGHCISVDPYYLTHKAQELGYHPDIILSGRRLNDNMSSYSANLLVKCMSKKEVKLNEAKVLVLGIAFKENCSDIRNTKVYDFICELKDFGFEVDVCDPVVSSSDVFAEYSIELLEAPAKKFYDAVVLAVPHRIFQEVGVQEIKRYGHDDCVFFDLKWCFPSAEADIRL